MKTKTTRPPRVYKQSGSVFVIGTYDVDTALQAAGITPETHHWSGTGFGGYVRRRGLWRAASELQPQKDARPGVVFFGPIRPRVVS